jgi:hypothetical protein
LVSSRRLYALPHVKREELSRVPPRSRAFGDDLPEAAAMPRELEVGPVEERREPKRPKQGRERPRQREHGEHRDSATVDAGDGRPVTKDKPPALTPLVLRHRGEEHSCLRVAERKQRETLGPIDRGDDTRRPATELSGPRIEKYGSPERHAYFARR